MKKILSSFLVLMLFLEVTTISFCTTNDIVDDMINDTAGYIYKNLTDFELSIGCEWGVFGLARSGISVPQEFYDNYYNNVEQELKIRNGNLHNKKYTEYSRVVIALTAIGKDPTNVAGYNLLLPLADYEKTIWQGINGAIWVLIAFDSANYEIPQNTNASVNATRQMYLNYILENQKLDGGWAISGDYSDPDVTAMALYSLSKYQENIEIKNAINKALLYLSQNQNSNGGFETYSKETLESSAQVIVALCELGISLDDMRFVKNGQTVFDNLATYYIKNNGFKHLKDSDSSNQMATEQAFYSMVALKRSLEGKNSLYSMDDVVSLSDKSGNLDGLTGKNADIKKLEIVSNKTFNDIKEHKNKVAIEALAKRNIISGRANNAFEPDQTMTRAEFATIIVKGLGLPLNGKSVFVDVTKNDWFFEYVNTAYKYEIVSGVSDTSFNPNGVITREEAATMITKASKLCGANIDMETYEVRDILSGFSDYIKASNWAMSSLAFCYDSKILPDDVMMIKPKEYVTRAEIAQMLYNMLDLCNLL